MPDPNDNKIRTSSGKSSPLGTLRSPVQDSPLKMLSSNLRDFLVERPVKVEGGKGEVFSNSGFGAGVRENLKEFFKPNPRGPASSGLMTNWNAGFSGFWQNLRDMISPPKLPPLETTSEPVAVPEIWSKNPQFTRVQALSIAFHVVVLALVIGPLLPLFFVPATLKPNSSPMVAIDLSKYHLTAAPAKLAGGGGGAHDNAPVTRGRTPKFSKMQFAAPMSHPMMNPKVAMTPTLLGNPEITPPNINANNWGSALSNIVGNSMGGGNGNGLGDGNGDGFGNGDKYGMGGGPPAGYAGYGNPKCLYCPNAQFSDEAVRAKFQGAVMVTALISADGRVLDVRLVKGLGLGLDEKALAAVKTWRFTPATGPDGKPAAVEQTIEVDFRLI